MRIPPIWTRLLLTSFLMVGIPHDWPAISAATLQNQEAPEIQSEETTPSFTVRAQRNEVLVRVVVRDKDGKSVGGLTKDDFRLLDNGKPQSVTLFKVETSKAAQAEQSLSAAPPAATPAQPVEGEPSFALPQRYVAFYFDDLVVTNEDMMRVRAAADKYIDSAMQPRDRAGVFTSSTIGVLDFTDDRAKLHGALAKLMPRPQNPSIGRECPPLTPYEAYLIDDVNDNTMLNIATWEVICCACDCNPQLCLNPQQQAQSAARTIWEHDQLQTRQCLKVLTDLVRRMSALPGQRSILWLSQGFLTFENFSVVSELIDRALREHVVINALDPRGLWVNIPGGDFSEDTSARHIPATLSMQESTYRDTGKRFNQDVLAEVAHDTGGVFVHNTNDFDGGFRTTAALPEFTYLLTFSPQNLKYDGKFHKLKVELVNGKGLSVQARNGYFAPNQQLHPEERAKQEIEDAAFAREEYLEFPVEVHTQFFKLSDTKAQLSITARIDARSLRFHKEGDRNLVNLKMVCVAFDRDGGLVDGTQKDLHLMLHDATLARLLGAGLFMRGQLKVSVGTYALRVVVYEVDSARMTALNRTVEIPY